MKNQIKTKICSKCKIEKPFECFYKQKGTKYNLQSACKDCIKLRDNVNKEKIKDKKKEYYINNRITILSKVKIHQNKFPDQKKRNGKLYRGKNKEKIKQKNKNYQKNKKQNDPIFKLRSGISRSISMALKLNNGSKHNRSCFEHLDYDSKELMDYLMNHPERESWMNENNNGVYRVATWDDNDTSTWKWQIDHIIPQSDLPYDSMDHPNFKKCWDLSNLRPLSAKQNLMDGATKIRHNKK